jgi:hypothetical protein
MAALLLLSACGQNSTESAVPVAAPAPVAPDAWDRDLLTLMPKIDRCIADARGPRQVSYAGDHNGITLVRLQGEAPVDCRVSMQGVGAALVVDIRPRDEALVIDGEDAAIFVRGPGENPGGKCYAAPEIRDGDGVLLGWMLDPAGC